MLDAIGAGAVGGAKEDWAQVWLKSDEYRNVSEEIERICGERRRADNSISNILTDQDEYAMPLIAQINAVIKRTFTSYWRDPNYLLGK
jgi:hypothetical protein